MSLQNSMIFWRQAFWKAITALGSIYIVFPVALLYLIVNKLLGIKLVLGIMGIYAVAAAIRLVYFKERPKKRPVTNILRRLDASSFPSIHSARAYFFALTLARFYQSTGVSIIFFILAVLVSFSRYRLHHHYASDIIGGAVLGIILSYIVEIPWIIHTVLQL